MADTEIHMPVQPTESSPGITKPYVLTRKQFRTLIIALEKNHPKRVRALVDSLHVADIADILESLSRDQRAAFLRYIDPTVIPDLLVELDQEAKEDVLELLGAKQTAKALTSLDTDDAIDVIEDLSSSGQQKILQALPKKHREELERSLAYPEDSAGRLMETQVVSVPEFWTVGQTIDFLRTTQDVPEDFYQIFLTDPKTKPVGGVLLSRVMRSGRDIKMKDIMYSNLTLIRAETDQEEVAFIFRQYGLVSAPVVNNDGRMIGVITLDDVVYVMEEEAHEDILHLGGVSEADFYSGFAPTVRRRFPWLLINLATALLASFVISFFEGTISKLATLAVLMPIVASMGGNAGIQTITVTVRALATKQLTPTNTMRVITKELLVGIINGLVFAVIVGATAYGWYHNMRLSITLGFATICTLTLAGLAGALIPLALEKCKIDPAIGSSVILTTVTDISAFAAFLGLAAWWLI